MRSPRNLGKQLLGLVLALFGLAGWIAAPGLHQLEEANPGLRNAQLSAAPRRSQAAAPASKSDARVNEAYGKLPLSFEANHGQTDSQVKFLSRGSGYSLFLTSTEAVLTLRKDEGRRIKDEMRATDSFFTPDPRGALAHTAPNSSLNDAAVLRMKLVGANPQPRVKGLEELPGKVNYLIGNDPNKWRTDIPTFAKVKYDDVYPGVNLIYYGNQRQLEYDLVVTPGADPAAIRMSFAGASKVEVNAQGDLVLHTAAGQVRQWKPLVYQELDGVRQEISGGYALHSIRAGKGQDKGGYQVAFQVATYDTGRPLVIDPVLLYSTYLGGSGGEDGFGIAVDSSGSTYVAGRTGSNDFPTTPGAFDPTCGTASGCNSGFGDAFVAKLNPAGSALVYSTYLGGSGDDVAARIALNPSCSTNCNAYLTGATTSPDFPTMNAFQSTYGGGGDDAFAAVLNDTGNALIYSTYLGGSLPLQANDEGLSIAVDSTGNGYVTGTASSSNFPTKNAFQAANAGGNQAFVAKFDPSQTGASSLVYSTYLGGGGHSSGGAFGDFGQRIAVDGSGNAYVTGITGSGDFPANPDLRPFPTKNALQPTYGGGRSDAFVAKFDPGGALLFSTFLGGSGTDQGGGIAVDASGIYVTGNTTSTAPSFPPVTPLQPTPFQSNNHGDNDVFVAKLGPTGSNLIYFTYLGGSSVDLGNDIAVDSAGQAFITGNTGSADFPMANPIQSVLLGTGDFFVTKMNATASALVYSTYLGGSGFDGSKGLALDSSGNVYVIGFAFSTDFPISPNALQSTLRGPVDAFVVKIGEAPDLAINKTASPNPVVTGTNLTYTITVTNNGPATATSVVVTDILPEETSFVACSATGGGVCGGTGNNRTVTFNSLPAGATETVSLIAMVNASLVDGASISNTATVSSATPDPDSNNNSATAVTRVSNPVALCQQALAAAQQQIQNLQNQVAVLTQQNAQLQSQVTTLTQQNQTLTQQNTQLQAQLTSANQTIASLNTQITQLESQVAALTQQNQTLAQQNADLQNQLAAANQTIANLNAQITQLQSQITTLTQQNAQLQSQVATLTQQNTQLQNQVNQLQATISQLQAQLAAATQMIQNLQNQIGQLQSQLAAANQQIANLQSQLAQCQAELAALKAPAAQVKAAIESVGTLLLTAPQAAQGFLKQAVKSLTSAQVALAAGDLDRAIKEIQGALQNLINAAAKGADTAALQRTLVEGVGVRVALVVEGVEAIVGSANPKVQEAKALLAQGEALLAQGKFKEALDAFQKAREKAADAG